MNRILLFYVVALVVIPPLSIKAQNYANSQTNGVSGVCIGCGITNPSNSVDGSNTTYATLNSTGGLLGACVWTTLVFPSSSTAGDLLTILLEDPSGGVLNASLLGGLQITTYSGASSNGTVSSSSLTINLLAGSSTIYNVSFNPCCSFDNVKVVLNAGLASVLSNLRLYSSYYTSSPLPVHLISFNGYSEKRNALLRWETASEIQSDYYFIERADAQGNFKQIAELKALGNTTKFHQYEYSDVNPNMGLNYYRLSQKDYNGILHYLGVVTVEISSNKVHFNLVNQETSKAPKIQISDLPIGKNIELKLYSVNGNILVDYKFYADENTYEYQLPEILEYNLGLLTISANEEIILIDKTQFY